jgi:hypothetical protein
MDAMFKHIRSDWILPWPTDNVKVQEKIHNPLGDEGLNYYSIDKTSINVFTKSLPKNLQNYLIRITLVDMQGPFTVHAHKDTGCKSAVNWYWQAGKGITRFYNSSNSIKIDNYLGYSVSQAFDRESLTLLGAFTADDGEVWILDTAVTHDVYMPLKTKRTFIQWGFNIDYKDLLCHFE